MARRTTMVTTLVATLLTFGTVSAAPAAAEEATPAPATPSASAEQLPTGDGAGEPTATTSPVTEPDAPSPDEQPTPGTDPTEDAAPTADPSTPPLPVEPAPEDEVEQPAEEPADQDDPAVDEVVVDESQDVAPEEAAAAPGPRPLAVPGDITLALSTTCEDASVSSSLTNTTDEAVDVRVRVTAEDGETSTQQLVLEAAEQRSVQTRLGGSGEVEVEVVEVLEEGAERLLATAATEVAGCLEVVESCEDVTLTNPAGNATVTLVYVDLYSDDEEEITEELTPGQSLTLPTDVEYVAAFSADAAIGAGEGYALIDFDACGLELAYVFSECRTDQGPGGALSFAFFVSTDTTATWTVTDADGRVVEEGVADEESEDLLVTGLAPGTYTLEATTGADEPEVSAEVLVGRCLDVALTCDAATFTNPASNPDALWVGLVDPDALVDPDSEDPFDISGLELHEVPAGDSFTFALLEDEVPWIAGDLASLTMDPPGPGVYLGEGELPARSTCPAPAPVDPTPAPVVDPVTDTDDGDEVPVATGANGGGGAVVTGGHGPVLAATGGPAGALGLLGLTALTAGVAVLRRRR
ncbi:hypothetical protein [Auraticoccus monumenti]|uniref:Gram-positive cocci surface proteins LPxTG domain-containing protein n=1 Tax=Auraticoccus monumenti TaxID=675864 RepID=A0A1G6YZT3_9ACTN|nr:hypothetical protein [Auraticoccus monumenti]SDD95583.1 hypothetical protein SAMN04489747_2139 [Auraticoccus monumenti]